MDLERIFEEAAARRVCPGGVVFCARGEKITAHQAFGSTAYDADFSRPVSRETIYDIASLSKLFTLTAFLIANREAKISENEPLARFLPEFDTSDKRAITLRHLMMHSAGFGLHIQSLYGQPCETWLEKIAAAPLANPPGETVNYTCTAYFVLARVLEKITGQRADLWLRESLLQPLGMDRTCFDAALHFDKGEIAPTELNDDGIPFHGVAHDEAARQWQAETGGFCGNSGLFSTASDLAKFCRYWLENAAEPEFARAFADTQLENAEGAVYRGWGWQLGNETYLSQKAPPGTAGHQGFTGPTLLLNPHTRDVVIVLNNRVFPSRTGPARFVYHRRVAEWHFGECRTGKREE